MNVPTTDNGIATDGIKVALTFLRNTKITATTSTMLSTSVNSTSCTASRIVTDLSDSTLIFTAGGSCPSICGSNPRIPSTIATVFEPGCF